MDRRTKFILLIIGSLILLGVVFWFIVWPLLSPVLPESLKPQPPAITEPASPSTAVGNGSENGGVEQGNGGGQTGAFTFSPSAESNPDIQRIIELSRRAGVLSERIESGSSENGFQNLSDAALNVSPTLAAKLRSERQALRDAYPASGPTYLTIARRLVEIPESATTIARDDFMVRVQMQVQVRDGDSESTEYRQSAVVFRRSGSEWITEDYSSEPFTP